MVEATIDALNEVNAHLAKQLENNASELQDLQDLLKIEMTERIGPHTFNPYPNNY
jgi:hypothetical protein